MRFIYKGIESATRQRHVDGALTRMGMRKVLPASLFALCVSAALSAQNPPSIASPASQKPPATKVAQTYAPELIQTGRGRFASQCGFCHGRDTQGGESGPDLTRSLLVAEDVRGDKLGPFLRAGKPDKGMPAFSLSDGDIAAVVAFIHDEKTKAESETGGRRSVEPADLQTGNAEAGKRYFNGAGGCARCHSLTGDFATIGSRYQGLALLQRMLYPGSGRDAGPAPSPPTLTVRMASGADGNGQTRSPRRVHDYADRHRRLATHLADRVGDRQRRRTSSRALRSASEIHR